MKRASVLLLLLACQSVASAKDPPPPGLTPPPEAAPEAFANLAKLEIVARHLDKPVGMVFAPGDPKHRLFIVEKTGKIRVFADKKVADAPYLDLSDKVSGANEQGLLGLAFHPKFGENGRLFVYYTDRNGDVRVVEYRAPSADADAADPKSARELLEVDHHEFGNHNGGQIVFGPDGKLYIAPGDGGAGYDPHGHGQSRKILLAKMMTLDVDAHEPKPEIAAIGLRNPWRYSFDRKTGDLYIADVGQDRYEELDVVSAGKLSGLNFGWSIMEGLHCLRGTDCDRKGLTLPVLEYGHGDGCSITGGYVYRGKALPELDGVYLFSDYCTALLRGVRVSDGQGKMTEYRDYKAAFDPGKRLATVSSFAEDEAGELYVISLDGLVWQLVRK